MTDSTGAPSEAGKTLLVDLHKEYVKTLSNAKHEFEYWVTEHLRVSGVYWGLSAIALLDGVDEMPKEEIIDWVVRCQHENGGFGGNIGHDPHLLYTLSAVQILAIFDALDRIDTEAVITFVSGLQQEDGSFVGDKWGEVDTRFSYCALNCLVVLGNGGQLPESSTVDVKAATDFVASCKNFDGGFGCVPGAESHAGQVFCCVAALAIGGALHHVDADLLGWWLCERQTKSGGLNGRPEKKPDVCYSWWILSALAILDKVHWINKDALEAFILSCQDTDTGGIADRKGDRVDVYHTFFGIAGLSLMGYEGLEQVDPVFALPVKVVERLGLPKLFSS